MLVQKKKEGRLKAIGVSNFSQLHLEEFRKAGVEVPEVNQIELHPFSQQKPIVENCRKAGILVQGSFASSQSFLNSGLIKLTLHDHPAYSPIIRGKKFDNPVIQDTCKTVCGYSLLFFWAT